MYLPEVGVSSTMGLIWVFFLHTGHETETLIYSFQH